MSRVVGVHGIAKHRLGRQQLLPGWVPPAGDGLERAAGHPVRPPDLDLAFYGDLFLSTRSGVPTKGVDEPSAESVTAQEAEWLAEAAGPGADEDVATKGIRTPLAAQALLRTLDRRFGAGAGVLHLGVLRQVRRYLTDPETKALVDARVDAAVRPECRVLLGHSLGAVVAFEYVRRHPDGPVERLVTLGGPLGLRMVRERLPALGPVRPRWYVVRDPRDPVACSGPLDPWWPDAVDTPVDNGPDAHSIERYLSHAQTGRILLDVLPDLADA